MIKNSEYLIKNSFLIFKQRAGNNILFYYNPRRMAAPSISSPIILNFKHGEVSNANFNPDLVLDDLSFKTR